ncbi:MAG: cytochrome c peroxidase [Planctomycetota bacterium]|jgi:cytochrome c peroxidase
MPTPEMVRGEKLVHQSRLTKIVGALATATVLTLAGVVHTSREKQGAHEKHPQLQHSANLQSLVEDSFPGPLQPLRAITGLDPKVVNLGDRLFHESRLSIDGTISCASCHDLNSGGDDGRPLAVGIGGAQGERNSPTVFNSGHNPFLLWDGRVRSLEEQVNGPIEDPKEMASNWDHVVAVLAGDPDYARAFQDALGEGPTPDGVRFAIAEFERSLMTLDSPFDQYMTGDESALSESAIRGYGLFLDLGCATCHQGANIGGNMRQPLGRIRDYLEGGDQAMDASGRQSSIFRVPSLRNVGITAPYFHDGSIPTLGEAVRVMAHFQLGEELKDSEVQDIVRFLDSLTGLMPTGAFTK